MNYYTDEQILERTLQYLLEQGKTPGSDGPSDLELTTGHALLVEEGGASKMTPVNNLTRKIGEEVAEYGASTMTFVANTPQNKNIKPPQIGTPAGNMLDTINGVKSFIKPSVDTYADIRATQHYKTGKNDQDTQNHINNINEFSDKYLNVNPDFDSGLSSTIGNAAGEVVRDTWGYVFAPKFATPTYNEVFSEHYPALRKRGLDHNSAVERANKNATLDLRNVINTPFPITRGAKAGVDLTYGATKRMFPEAATTLKKYGDDFMQGANRYVDDINPSQLIDEGIDNFNKSSIGKGINSTISGIKNYSDNLTDQLTNSKAFNKANDIIPEGLKDKTRNFGRLTDEFGSKMLSSAPQSITEYTTSQISENIQNQRIGNDVGTFDDAFPEFNDVAKQRINATTKQEILDWWDAYWK